MMKSVVYENKLVSEVKMLLRKGQISHKVLYVMKRGGFFEWYMFQCTCFKGPWPQETQAAMSHAAADKFLPKGDESRQQSVWA